MAIAPDELLLDLVEGVSGGVVWVVPLRAAEDPLEGVRAPAWESRRVYGRRTQRLPTLGEWYRGHWSLLDRDPEVRLQACEWVPWARRPAREWDRFHGVADYELRVPSRGVRYLCEACRSRDEFSRRGTWGLRVERVEGVWRVVRGEGSLEEMGTKSAYERERADWVAWRRL